MFKPAARTTSLVTAFTLREFLLAVMLLAILSLFRPLVWIERAEAHDWHYPRLQLVTEEYPPLNMTGDNGKITGYATELLRLAADDLGLKVDISLLPWKRAYMMAQEKPNTCVYSTWRTEEREKLFRWVGPLAMDGWSFYALEETALNLTGIEDTFNYRVGGVDGWGFTQFLQEKQHPLLDLTPSEDKINARKLLSGRIDLWATGRISGDRILKELQVSGVRETFTIREIGLWVACNLHTDRHVLKDLQQALSELEKSGTATKVREGF